VNSWGENPMYIKMCPLSRQKNQLFHHNEASKKTKKNQIVKYKQFFCGTYLAETMIKAPFLRVKKPCKIPLQPFLPNTSVIGIAHKQGKGNRGLTKDHLFVFQAHLAP
jgi:hypothetical protein